MRSVSKLRLSLASPPVRWKAIGKHRSRSSSELGRETATRAAKRLICCPLLRPLPRYGLAPRWHRTSAPNAPSRSRRQGIEERFESSRSAQPPELLPHAVPAPEFLRKSPPSDIMNHKIVQGFEKLSVVPALVAAPRPRCREHPQYNRPILFRHGRDMVGPPKTDCRRVREKVIWESLYPILGSIGPHGLISPDGGQTAETLTRDVRLGQDGPSCRSCCTGRCRQAIWRVLQPDIHDVRAMSACVPTADAWLHRGGVLPRRQSIRAIRF